MRLLFTIPHFYKPGGQGARDGRWHGAFAKRPEARIQALNACVAALHQLWGGKQCIIDQGQRITRPANQFIASELDVVICTTQGRHLIPKLSIDSTWYTHHATGAEPMGLGFECQAVLRDRLGRYDYYCYLEDDLIVHDPWFFAKLAWFTGHVGDDKLLQPNRFERAAGGLVHKAYIDGDLAPHVVNRFFESRRAPRLLGQVLGTSVVFRRALNPHAGCYFLNRAQMERWVKQPYFLDRDASFIGPLESAATLGILRTFKVYKTAPEHAGFFEIEHFGSAFLSLIRLPGARASARRSQREG
jgi:hypothetical protein